MTLKIPKYLRNGKRARVRINRQFISLGVFNSPASRAKYNEIIAEYLRTGGTMKAPESDKYTIAELVLAYLSQLKVAVGASRDSEFTRTRDMFRKWLKNYLESLVKDFTVASLRGIRQEMINANRVRKGINADIDRVVRMFRWAAEEELIQEAICKPLAALKPLRHGTPGVRESEQKKPVDLDVFNATLLNCSPVIADMARIHRLCGCRPKELVNLTPRMIKCQGKVWECHLTQHKNAYRQKPRVLLFGPRAQKHLKKYLKRDADAYLFSPQESEEARRKSQQRTTPLNQGNRSGYSDRSRKGDPPQKSPGVQYTTQSYGKAIGYACQKTFVMPEGLSDVEIKDWKTKHCWTPGRLRHTAATLFAEKFGIQTAASILGHSRVETTQIYAEDTLKRAKDAIEKLG